MEELISICGINCSECDGYIATQENDDGKRAKTAVMWSKMYNADIKPFDINCDGCTVKSDRHIGHWETCAMRTCAVERGLVNCAHCDDYVCDKLEGFFKFAPEAKIALDSIREGLK